MGDKKSPSRPKRQAKQADDGYWDCSVCTFRNTAEAFKCNICDVRKGTSTRKPRINSQLVAQQVAQQYPMPPPAKKERRERSERTDRERADGEGESAIGEARPEGERPEIVRPEIDTSPPDIDKSDKEQPKEQPIQDKADRERDIIPALTKKPSIKKSRSVSMDADRDILLRASLPHWCLCLSSPRPKSDNHQSPPSDKQSIQSGKSATKTNNKNNHISRPKLKNIDRSTAQQLAITVGNVTVIITDFKEKSRSSSTSSSTITSSAGSEQQHQSSGSESMDKGSSRASTPKGDLSAGHDESF
ncbi:RING1 and YY1-binding protein B isoform X1 [Phyllopteryx taeniolatus]|uniref:RING1 and YY1-binding protein B isoform X1 n=1 Tax=Phyllopteryx taeniolatus TaxID=161469 RepID=UPI002AD3FCFA|nr:RING1 and YY1-binding protein B isoform X1 [Phyllopteryx taeniolatus]